MGGSWLLREAMNDSIRSVSAAIPVVLTYRRWKSAMSLTISVKSDLIASNAVRLVRFSTRNRARLWLKTVMSVSVSFAILIGMSYSPRAVNTAKPLFLVSTSSLSALIGTTVISSAPSVVTRLTTA